MLRARNTALRAAGVPLIVAIVAVAVGYGLSVVLSDYLVFLGTTAIVAAIAILGLGVVTGSAGMISLCQLTFAAIGAWVVAWLNTIDAPGGFILWLVLGALAAGVVGILVGLPALRLRGVNLAVVTLGFAAAADVTLVQIQFPGATAGVSVLRPDLFSDDRSYFLLAVLAMAICAVIIHFVQHSRLGSSWKSVAFSERGTASVGASVSSSKLTAFAISAALGGVSGGLVVGQVGLAFPSSFSPIQSLALYVLSIMSGAHLVDMAIFGGILWVVVPELLKRWGVPQDWAFVIFGALGVQALTSGSNLGTGIRNVWWKRQLQRAGRTVNTLGEGVEAAGAAAPQPPAPVSTGAPVLVVEDLSVAFGNIKALKNVSLTVPEHSIMGLIGPNGAGKSTLVDAISGFLPQHTGAISLGGKPLHGLSPTRRARLGLRRTFQQDRVPPGLTIGAYMRFVARRRTTPSEVEDLLQFMGCPPSSSRLAAVDVGTRRLVEVAANILSKPRVLLLDEPAAGLSHEEHVDLGRRLLQVPERYGVSVLLIEHDLDMVRSVCSTLTVLDFGEVLDQGPQDEVLANPAVIKAYMGETEML
ncbi:ABC transporter permease subunit [Specibacter cremeus]|uniref:branched-chain amino acid ABC transporter ATP-binding protein/permease n=1 Tax=Specibacter cremeus TaxID=1629051 RepID=UPI000F766C6F|nr:ATP-binding cassette domain-containing protein [Specibacter cremeus]